MYVPPVVTFRTVVLCHEVKSPWHCWGQSPAPKHVGPVRYWVSACAMVLVVGNIALGQVSPSYSVSPSQYYFTDTR